MKPVSPVVAGLEKHETFKGGPRAGQPEYLELPCLLTEDGGVISRWQPTPEERKWIAENDCDIVLTIYSGGQPYPPTSVQVMSKAVYFGDTPELAAESAALNLKIIPLADRPEAKNLLRNPDPAVIQ
jgi:hypothetical protein